MSWGLALQAIETGAVVIGIAFGLIQPRQLRHQREVQAGLELLAPLQAPDSTEALLIMHELPDNLTGEELRHRLGAQYKSAMATLGLFESLGPIVARGHVPVGMYARVLPRSYRLMLEKVQAVYRGGTEKRLADPL